MDGRKPKGNPGKFAGETPGPVVTSCGGVACCLSISPSPREAAAAWLPLSDAFFSFSACNVLCKEYVKCKHSFVCTICFWGML